MADPYQLPELIVTRLSSLDWPALHFADFANVRDGAQVTPALLVMPYALAVADDGTSTALRETVLIAAMVRNTNQRSGAAARVAAGPILTAAAALLTGWQPTTEYLPLQIETPPQPIIEAGFVSYFLQYASNYALE